MKKIKVICDSLADVPKEYQEKYNIEVLPITIILNGREYKDNVDLTPQEFYDKVRSAAEMPKTAQVSYAQLVEAFKRNVDAGYTVLFISASSAATGGYQGALLAKDDVEGDIHVFDSFNLSAGIGLLVIKAGELASSGMSIDELVKRLHEIRDLSYLCFSVKSLEFLKKGGRISGAKAFVGSMLHLRPMLQMKDGISTPVMNTRGTKATVNALVDQLVTNCGEDFSDKMVVVGQCDSQKDYDLLLETVKSRLKPKGIIPIYIGAGIASHTGPDLIGLAAFKDSK